MRLAHYALVGVVTVGCGGGAPAAPTPPPTTLPPMTAPEPVAPADGAVFDHFPRTLTLEWTAVPRASTYTVEIEACPQPACFEGATSPYRPVTLLTGTSYTFSFVGEQPGRWRVYAIDDRGNAGPRSAWRHFRFTV